MHSGLLQVFSIQVTVIDCQTEILYLINSIRMFSSCWLYLGISVLFYFSTAPTESVLTGTEIELTITLPPNSETNALNHGRTLNPRLRVLHVIFVFPSAAAVVVSFCIHHCSSFLIAADVESLLLFFLFIC